MLPTTFSTKTFSQCLANIASRQSLPIHLYSKEIDSKMNNQMVILHHSKQLQVATYSILLIYLFLYKNSLNNDHTVWIKDKFSSQSFWWELVDRIHCFKCYPTILLILNNGKISMHPPQSRHSLRLLKTSTRTLMNVFRSNSDNVALNEGSSCRRQWCVVFCHLVKEVLLMVYIILGNSIFILGPTGNT